VKLQTNQAFAQVRMRNQPYSLQVADTYGLVEFGPSAALGRQDEAVPDHATDTVTVMDRLLAAGLTPERAEDHLRSDRVKPGGELVTDPYRAAPPPARLVLVTARRPRSLALLLLVVLASEPCCSFGEQVEPSCRVRGSAELWGRSSVRPVDGGSLRCRCAPRRWRAWSLRRP
jgi:hypothetical protein